MQALISPHEGNRILEVKANNRVFEVAEPLFWVDCPSNCKDDWIYNGSEFIEPKKSKEVVTDDIKVGFIKDEIKGRLSASDWTQLPDVLDFYGVTFVAEWTNYRNELRRIDINVIDLENPLLPTPPDDTV